MKNAMMTVAEASELINDGAILVIGGSHTALEKLPQGKWIGGSSYYFMTADGGRVDRENVFVTQLDAAADAKIVPLGAKDLPELTNRPFKNGISVILIPAFSEAHSVFAIDGAQYENLFDQPLMGWVAGVHLDEIGETKPAVFDGMTGQKHEDEVVVLHADLPDDHVAMIDIVNPFEQNLEADEISFPETGFTATRAIVNGKEVDFAAYVAERGLDTALPLVANYAGAMINVSFQSVDAETGVVFYAPVVKGVTYRIAKSLGNYAATFSELNERFGGDELSCNCILNYLYGNLEGETLGKVTGPATFGEVAYMLINQTQVNAIVDPGQDLQNEAA